KKEKGPQAGNNKVPNEEEDYKRENHGYTVTDFMGRSLSVHPENRVHFAGNARIPVPEKEAKTQREIETYIAKNNLHPSGKLETYLTKTLPQQIAQNPGMVKDGCVELVLVMEGHGWHWDTKPGLFSHYNGQAPDKAVGGICFSHGKGRA